MIRHVTCNTCGGPLTARDREHCARCALKRELARDRETHELTVRRVALGDRSEKELA